MALIKIYKGDKSMLIPAGAYKYQYAPAGWLIEGKSHIKNESDHMHMEEIKPPVVPEENSLEDEYEKESEEEMEEESEETEDKEIQDIEEKPLSELTVPELRLLAEHKGIDITGLTSAKKLRDAIKREM